MTHPDSRPSAADLPEATAADLLRHIAEQSRDLIAAIDGEFRLTTCNQAYRDEFRSIFGRELEVGVSLREALAGLPEEWAEAHAAWSRALAGEEYTIIAPFGDPQRDRRIYELTFRPLRDGDGAVVGAFHVARDVTAREEARAEVERLNARLEERIAERTEELEGRRRAAELERKRLQAVLDILPVGVWIADENGRMLERNRAGTMIWGDGARLSSAPEHYAEDYRAWWPDGRRVEAHEWGLARALSRGEVSIAEEMQIETADGRRKTILNYALPIRGEGDRIVGGVVVNVDITGRKVDERREELLAAAGAVLSSPLEMEGRLERLAAVMAARLADYAIIDLVDADGELRRLEVGHGGGAEQASRAERLRRYPSEGGFWEGTTRAVERGEVVLVAEVPQDAPEAVFQRPGHAALARELNVRSILVVPLRADGRVTGALTLISARPERLYGRTDMEVVTELADRVALALENVRLFEKAQRAIREREEVVALVSHDLRNPLNTIQLAAGILEEEAIARERREMQPAVIRRSVSQMNRLIEDLLDVTRMGAGTFRVSPEPQDPGAIVDEALQMAAAAAGPRGVRVETLLADRLPRMLADRDRLLQVFSNLINNAVGFTPEGGRVVVRVEPDGDRVRFTVADSGPGVDPAERENIFERFWQGARGSTGGAGLGLSIAKGIVEAHGGSIRLIPRDEHGPDDGPGATFRFWIPAVDPAV